MEFGLSEDQRLIEQSLRGHLADAVDLDLIRRLAADKGGFDADLWAGLCELGLPGLLVAEAHGGTGLGMLEAAVAAEALGYSAAPTPFVGACVMAPLAVSLAGGEEQRRHWLPAIAAGEVRLAVGAGALAGATGTAELSLSGAHLSGRLTGLLDGGGASHALVYLADGRAAIVALDADGVALSARPSLDRTRPLADLDLDDAEAVLLDGADDAPAVARRVLDAGRLMLAADTLGAGQCMIDQAVDYAGQRVQFERVIASYQAVKHMCAEMVANLEPCRSLVWYAAHVQDLDDEAERRVLACLAKAHLAEVGREVARTATEVHGGMGFTDLMGLHFWFKRISYDRQVLGGPERCRQDAARAQGWLAA
ncbi:MAG: acyl-CoA dehydrogenase family protein [Alphaproteobacteria bacterium]|jgi:alkylation response protein AidB-like acyl-CoA dehydrogenase|nr:acyl-CoA dehydrogenase family protein [Alphaproteobacteria bacterium]MDP6564041.1 acyl-CoA dehydrogenase family protein [Alphaproteobacteria bacterium]MDP6812238.1 acyl-CoA dehydrogenase family protein [Alphaproteobacteria bacterium]